MDARQTIDELMDNWTKEHENMSEDECRALDMKLWDIYIAIEEESAERNNRKLNLQEEIMTALEVGYMLGKQS